MLAHRYSNHTTHAHFHLAYVQHITLRVATTKQEAQLPRRNSASPAHMEGGSALQPTPPPRTLATPMRMIESETRNKRIRQVCRPLRTL